MLEEVEILEGRGGSGVIQERNIERVTAVIVERRQREIETTSAMIHKPKRAPFPFGCYLQLLISSETETASAVTNPKRASCSLGCCLPH